MQKELRLSKYELAPIYIVMLASLYFVISGIIINGIVQIVCFGILIFFSFLLYKDVFFHRTDVFWLISITPFFYCIKDWRVSDIRDFIAYLTFAIFVMFVKVNPKYLNKSFKLLLFMSFFHVFFVFLNVLFKNQFSSFIYSILGSGAVSTYDIYHKAGYYSGFGYIPGDTSGYLVDGIILLTFGSKIFRKKHRILMIMILVVGVFFCAKRSHFLCLAMALLITWILTAKGNRKLKRIVLSTIIFFSVLTLGYVLLPFFKGIPMIERISLAVDSFMNGQDYTHNRNQLNSVAVQFFNDNRMFGAGWKFFNAYTFARWGHSNYVNNDYIQLAAETGLVGLILFVTPMLLCLIGTIRKIRFVQKENSNSAEYKLEYLSVSMAFQCFFLLYNVFEIPFYDYTFLFIYGYAIVTANSFTVNNKINWRIQS